MFRVDLKFDAPSLVFYVGNESLKLCSEKALEAVTARWSTKFEETAISFADPLEDIHQETHFNRVCIILIYEYI